jgi:hypothetical protein
MLNKKGIGVSCLILGFLFISCAPKDQFSVAKLEHMISFHNLGTRDKVQIEGAIYLPDEFIQKMLGLSGGDPNLWPWFFKRGIGPVFEKAEVINNLEEMKSRPNVKIIVKPELWGFYFQRYYTSWTCWLDFRYKLLDRNGNVITSIAAEGKSFESDKFRALSSVMNDVVKKFQKDFLLKKEEVLGKSL